MKIKIFTVPAMGDDKSEEALNRFLGGNKIISIDKHFMDNGVSSFWSFCVCYGESMEPSPIKKGRVDYREVLSEEEFTLYLKLRALRKSISEEAGVPAYAVFTNEQLASIVRDSVVTKDALKEISGVGDLKADKYGGPFLKMMESRNGQAK